MGNGSPLRFPHAIVDAIFIFCLSGIFCPDWFLALVLVVCRILRLIKLSQRCRKGKTNKNNVKNETRVTVILLNFFHTRDCDFKHDR